MYQPGIWTPSRATAVGSRTTSCSSTWGPANFEDLCAALTIALGIVSTWNLVPRRGQSSFLNFLHEHCINLESVQLRRQISTEALKHRNYINLRFGQLRGLEGQDHVGVVDRINLGAAKTRTSPTPTAQANDTAFQSLLKSTICKQMFYLVHFRSSKGYNFFIRNTLRERSPHVRRQVGGTPEHPRR